MQCISIWTLSGGNGSAMAALVPSCLPIWCLRWDKKRKTRSKNYENECPLCLGSDRRLISGNDSSFPRSNVLKYGCQSHYENWVGSMPAIKLAHAELLVFCVYVEVFVGNRLIDIYVNSACVQDALMVFNRIHKPNVLSWNIMIGAYQYSEPSQALLLFQIMQTVGPKPNKVTFSMILHLCSDHGAIDQGKFFHSCILNTQLDSDVFVGNALVNMYGKCRCVDDAWKVFHKMLQPSVVSWTAMISAAAKNGQCQEAFLLFQQMQEDCMVPNKVTFLIILDTVLDLAKGKWLHAQILDNDFDVDIVVVTTVLNMYAKCGCIESAGATFNRIPRRDVAAWNSMLAAHANGKNALQVFRQMNQEHVIPNAVSFISILNACGATGVYAEGKRIHSFILLVVTDFNIALSTSIINMYGKCGTPEDSYRIFENMINPNLISWNAIIAAYTQNGQSRRVSFLFHQMQLDRFIPDKSTWIYTLNSCTKEKNLIAGKVLHVSIQDNMLDLDTDIANALINMYGKSNSLEDMEIIFDRMSRRSVLSWNLMIASSADNGRCKDALQIYREMEPNGVIPDKVTCINIINACANDIDLSEKKLVHANILSLGYEENITVSNALINMYGKSRSYEGKWKIFNTMPFRNVVTWTTMIVLAVESEHDEVALVLFKQMQMDSILPDKVAFISILEACANLAALNKGKEIHALVILNGLDGNAIVGASLIDMYGKCGDLKDMCVFFDKMYPQDSVLWNAMIAAYCQNGHGNQALQFFNQMQKTGILADEITFLSSLSACSHAGQMDLGAYHFVGIACMGITLNVSHYGCVVDLFGHFGWLDEADDIANSMALWPDAQLWMTFLGACRIHQDVDRGTYITNKILELEIANC